MMLGRVTFDEVFPLYKGGGAKRQGVVRPAFPNPFTTTL
jgi:hypothetical protein